jgi:hypothetical protein
MVVIALSRSDIGLRPTGSDLWLAQKGALTGDGIHHLIQRRAVMAGVLCGVMPSCRRDAELAHQPEFQSSSTLP